MAVLDILRIPNPLLKKVSEQVAEINDEIRKDLEDMLETLEATDNGVAIAAPQVGILKRLIVINLSRSARLAEEEGAKKPIFMINPEIIEFSEEKSPMEEGCLSVPDEWEEVIRPVWVKVRYTDLDGSEQVIETDGFLAKCIQHEIDHLNGILFIDKLSRLRRDVIMRRAKKQEKLTREHGEENE